MIVTFSVSNFRSFDREETFSLVASKRFSSNHEMHAVRIPNSEEFVLRAAVIYGANGAGKSNFFKALRYVRNTALNPRAKGAGTQRVSFRFSDKADAPSVFDLQFLAGDKLYRFGFKVDDTRIVEEYLVEVRKRRETVIFERLTSDDGIAKVSAPKLEKANDKLGALVTIGAPHNQSFLATVRATLEPEDYGKDLSTVIDWFEEHLTLVDPDANFNALGHKLGEEEEFRDFCGEFLKLASTGVDKLQVNKTELKEQDFFSLLPEQGATMLQSGLVDADVKTAHVIHLPAGKEFLVEKGKENHFYQIAVEAMHKISSGDSVPLPLRDESDGTRRLLNLLPALHEMSVKGITYFIDEVDRSMHPLIVIEFLKFFLKACKDAVSQIIVTTHESNLLDQELLRRDEIWFAEKDSEHSTRLYSLAEFNVRKDLSLRRNYLQGRFGAIPFLGNLESLLEK